MFAWRERTPIVELTPGQERTFRLPPMSEGPVIVKVYDADFTRGPHGELVPHDGLAGDLQVTLFRPGLEVSDDNSTMATSLWQDAHWRLRLRRKDSGSGSTDPWKYLVKLQYPTQLPLVDRPVPARFFERGFDENWNHQGEDEQGYILIQPEGSVVTAYVEHAFGHEYGLGEWDGNSKWNTLVLAHFPSSVEVENFIPSPVVFSVGAGPRSAGGPTSLFLSARITFPAGGKILGPLASQIPVGEFTAVIRMYLYAAGGSLSVSVVVEAALIDKIPTVDRAEVKRSIEVGITQNMLAVGAHIQPWLVGGPNELVDLTYEPGAGDVPDANGIIEPATGRLIVRYVGQKVVYEHDPVIGDGWPVGVPDVAEALFTREELRDEEPEPRPGYRGTEPPPDPLDPVAVMEHRRRVRNWKSSIGRLIDIEHIVVLMQENRSFDNMLGYLSRENGRMEVDGLNSLPPDPANPQVNHFRGLNYFPQREASTAWPDPDMHGPGHDYENATAQMQDNMGGFVADWAARVGENSPHLQLVMNYFGPDQVTEYAKLAEEFAICNRWFCSFPGPTWPNRFVYLSGDLSEHQGRVEIHNPDLLTMIPRQEPILPDYLSEREGVDWLVFEHGYSYPRLYGKYTYETDKIRPFEDPNVGFEAVANGGLPSVTFIEPDYIEVPPGNDDHAPADVADGQALVAKIMRALVQSPSWNKTLFIITYDEHGGFYDHVIPPHDAAPLRSGERTRGPRVPTFVVSPLIKRQTVLDTIYDHTSITATIVRRFCGPNVPHVSERVAAAKDLQEAINLATPRPASDFTMFGSGGGAPIGPTVRSLALRRRRIGSPESPGDFHWFLSAIRMLTGSP
jgi:phospholipase C